MDQIDGKYAVSEGRFVPMKSDTMTLTNGM